MDTNSLEFVLRKNQAEFGSLFPFSIDNENSIVLDFSERNVALSTINLANTYELSNYVTNCLQSANAVAGVGGYNEERVIYKRSKLFVDQKGNPRFIHLGIDIWIEPNTIICCPIDGIVHSLKDNKGFGDFGPTIILEHEIDGVVFYTLYGHLTEISIESIKVGDFIKKNQNFCSIGLPPSNGDWPPHLHFQIISNMLDYDGDYAAVCSLPDREIFLNLCPNPNIILQIPSLPI